MNKILSVYFQDLAVKSTEDDTFTTVTKKNVFFLTAINCMGQKLGKWKMTTSVK